MNDLKNKSSEERMGTAPVLQLIFSMSLPSMFSMLILALYNIVDSIYVSRLGEYALSALSLIYPIQMLNVAVGVGTGIGLASLISRKLGENRYDEAQNAADHGVIIAVWSWAVFALFGLFGMGPFVRAFSSTPILIEAAEQYGSIVCLGCLFAFNSTNAERIMQACGNMMAPMWCSLAGCITNVILDPIMIFGYLGCPAMGVTGAAVATVIGQLVQMLCCFAVVNFAKLPIKIEIKLFKPNPSTIRQIYNVALPSMVMQSIASITTLALNAILVSFSEAAVAALGVYFKLQSFVFMPIFGMNNGMIPIVSYNYGAQKRRRMMDTYKFACLYAIIIMSVGLAMFELIPDVLFKLFKASDNMLGMGVPALRIIAVHFPVAAYCIVTGSVFQSLGKAVYSMINSIMRQIVVLLPAAYFLALTGNVNNIWWSFPIAEIMSALVTTLFFIKVNKEVISKIPD